MLNSLVGKTIFNRRWSLLGWGLGVAALVLFTMIFFPTLSKSLGDSLKNVPESMKSFLGDAATYSTIEGYTDLQVISQLQFMLLIFGVILFSGLIAGEEGDGTLQTLLVQPIKRSKIYLHKFLAGGVLLAIITLAVTVGILASLPLIHESLNFGRLSQAALAMWLITLVFGALAYCLGAVTGRRGLSGGLSGAAAFTSFLISSLAEPIKALRGVDRFSPFHYFNKPGILQHGLNWNDMLVLSVATAVLVVIGYWRFERRDIYQR